jgi:hypothetical protein
VTDFRVELRALAPGATPAASFASMVGSTAACASSFGDPAADRRSLVFSGQPFGASATTVSINPFAGGAAALAGDVFGMGATVQTSAYASSLASLTTAQGTIGLVNDVSTAAFTLAPWTEMTISAQVRASASSTGANPFESADSGILLAISDSDGAGPQWAYVNFDAFAFGGFGPVEDAETAFLRLRYENDSAVAVSGLFSGYVSSLAISGLPLLAVPEPSGAALLVAGLLAAACLRRPARLRAGGCADGGGMSRQRLRARLVAVPRRRAG